LIIGAQKTGTTTLWAQLRQHPDVFLPDDKEPNFFVEELGWPKGRKWYEALFEPAGDSTQLGEASTLYTMYPTYAGVPARIASMVPDVKIIYVMREPIARMESLYGLHLMAGWERRPISEALLLDTRYVDSSRYAMQIEQYLRHFSMDQMHFLTTEALRDRPAATLRGILEFLDVDPDWTPPDADYKHNTRDEQRVPRDWWRAIGGLLIRSHLDALVPDFVVRHNRYKLLTRPIRPEERHLEKRLQELLADVLKSDVERLQQWMGTDFDGWGYLNGEQAKSRTRGATAYLSSSSLSSLSD
jgi:hypothetical protein